VVGFRKHVYLFPALFARSAPKSPIVETGRLGIGLPLINAKLKALHRLTCLQLARKWSWRIAYSIPPIRIMAHAVRMEMGS
jgi:hypothetical protein